MSKTYNNKEGWCDADCTEYSNVTLFCLLFDDETAVSIDRVNLDSDPFCPLRWFLRRKWVNL